MDVNLINPFLFGAKDVLLKMARTETTTGAPSIKRDGLADGDVSGVIGLTGDVVGSLAISFSEPSICSIAGRILNESFARANQEVFDSVGEITNMISGVARTQLEKKSLTVLAGIPAVIFGVHHRVRHILKSPSIVIPFATDVGSFFVDVCIKRTLTISHIQRQANERPESLALDGMVPPVSAVREAPSAPITEMAPEARIEQLRRQLDEIRQVKDSLEQLLREKPFMNIQTRQKYTKAVPGYEKKIKQLRTDIAAAEMLKKIPGVEGPVNLPRHYQRYPAQKPPRR